MLSFRSRVVADGCFNKAKRDLEKCGFKVEFKEAGQP